LRIASERRVERLWGRRGESREENVFLGFFLLGCAPSGEGARETSGPVAAASSSSPVASLPVEMAANRSGRVELPLLPPDAVRASLFVLPGDAAVEVDGVPVRRRNGAVELIGVVGEVRRVRTFRGSLPGEEKLVTIEAKGTSPAWIDANEVKPAAPVKVKSRPARFNVDE